MPPVKPRCHELFHPPFLPILATLTLLLKLTAVPAIRVQEVPTHDAQLTQYNPPTRSDPSLHAPDHPCQGGPSTGPAHRHPGLGRIGATGPADSLCQAEERRGTAAALACLTGGDGNNGYPQAALSGHGGPDPILSPRPLPLGVARDEWAR